MATRALELHQAYGNYAIANTFSSNDNVPEMVETDLPAYGAAFDTDNSVKHHAACDECRKRKLKCSGQPIGCARCVKQTLICHYSIQKQMGRPRKRQRMEEPNSSETSTGTLRSGSSSTAGTAIDPSLTPEAYERTNFENICNGPISQAIKRKAPNASQNPASISSASSYDAPRTPPDDFLNISYPTDVSLWPDFSDMTLPVPLQESYEKETMLNLQSASTDPDANPSYLQNLPSTPECPCLPNLYLTLSTLSTLSSFPVASQTIDTLEAAHRTARSVIYCRVCPQQFQSGSQNVMLSGTLLTVLVDQWQRVRKSPAIDLRKGFGSSDADERPMFLVEDLQWRTYAHTLIRAHVFGDQPIPVLPTGRELSQSGLTSTVPGGPGLNVTASSPQFMSRSSSQRPTLMGLAEAMERRQRQWHGLDEKTDEFPRQLTQTLAKGHLVGMTLEDMQNYAAQVKDHLCLQIVEHAKRCIRTLDRPTPSID